MSKTSDTNLDFNQLYFWILFVCLFTRIIWEFCFYCFSTLFKSFLIYIFSTEKHMLLIFDDIFATYTYTYLILGYFFQPFFSIYWYDDCNHWAELSKQSSTTKHFLNCFFSFSLYIFSLQWNSTKWKKKNKIMHYTSKFIVKFDYGRTVALSLVIRQCLCVCRCCLCTVLLFFLSSWIQWKYAKFKNKN